MASKHQAIFAYPDIIGGYGETNPACIAFGLHLPGSVIVRLHALDQQCAGVFKPNPDLHGFHAAHSVTYLAHARR